MQPGTHFQTPGSSQTHVTQPHQMFVSANGQFMTAAPMVSIAMPTPGTQQTVSATGNPSSGTTACYGSPFQPFLMGQSAAGQPAGMVAWQPTAAWSAYQHAAAAAAAAAVSGGMSQQTQGHSQQQQQQQNSQQQGQVQNQQQQHPFGVQTQQQTQQTMQHHQQQHFVFTGSQSTVAQPANPAAGYPQQLYLASAPSKFIAHKKYICVLGA